jgi:hypothetical protein
LKQISSIFLGIKAKKIELKSKAEFCVVKTKFLLDKNRGLP